MSKSKKQPEAERLEVPDVVETANDQQKRYQLTAYPAVMLAGKVIERGETITAAQYKALCDRIKPYFEEM